MLTKNRIARAALLLMAWFPVAGADSEGWFKAGSHPAHYDMGIDRSVVFNGKSSGYIRSNRPDPEGFGTYMQMFDATEFRGKRMQFSAFVKTENVESWASLWMRVDGEGRPIAFDNMQKRQIKGTQNWTKYSIVLDVDPTKAVNMAFGVMMAGKGAVWIDGVKFEPVGENVPVTDMFKEKPKSPAGPSNLSFDKN